MGVETQREGEKGGRLQGCALAKKGASACFFFFFDWGVGRYQGGKLEQGWSAALRVSRGRGQGWSGMWLQGYPHGNGT